MPIAANFIRGNQRIKGSLCATPAVIVVAIRVRVSGVVAVGNTSVRRIIVPIAAAEAGTTKQRFLRR